MNNRACLIESAIMKVETRGGYTEGKLGLKASLPWVRKLKEWCGGKNTLKCIISILYELKTPGVAPTMFPHSIYKI